MSAVSAIVDVAKAAASVVKSDKLYNWIGRLSLYWTAWSVLSSFKTVQDVLDFLKHTASELNDRLGWVLGLILWGLERAAAVFHLLIDVLFGWVPVLNLIPVGYHEPIVIASLAVVPSVISLIRVIRISQYTTAIQRCFNEWINHPSLLRVYHDTQKVVEKNGGLKKGEEQEHDFQNYAFRMDPPYVDWLRARRRAERAASAVVSILGFRALSARLFLSVLLVGALAWEYQIKGDGSVDGAATISSLIAIVFGAFGLGLLINFVNQVHRARAVPGLGIQIAKIWSLPITRQDFDIPEDMLVDWRNKHAAVDGLIGVAIENGDLSAIRSRSRRVAVELAFAEASNADKAAILLRAWRAHSADTPSTAADLARRVGVTLRPNAELFEPTPGAMHYLSERLEAGNGD